MHASQAAFRPHPRARAVAWAAVLLALAACQPAGTPPVPAEPPAPVPVAHGAPDPVQAVTIPTALLRRNDYAGFARATVPADVHARLEQAWRQGQTRWPLDELPFAARLPQLLTAFARPGAEAGLTRAYDRQFAGATRELQSTARALGVFGTEYLRTGEGFSSNQRSHYTQLVEAAAAWAIRAPLGDKALGHAAIRRAAQAAAASDLGEEARFAHYGMDESLRRIGPFLAAAKATTLDYGLDLDAALDGMRVELLEVDGDSARLRMRYALGARPIDATVLAVRIDGRWYLVDFLASAREAAAVPEATPDEVDTGVAAPAGAAPSA